MTLGNSGLFVCHSYFVYGNLPAMPHILAMPKRIQIAPGALLLALAGVIAWPVLRRPVPEPVYNGKVLHIWLQEYYENRNSAARHAIQQIGTNAIPTLLSMLRERDFYSKSNLTYRLAADLSPWRIISARSVTDKARITVEAGLLDQVRKNPAYVLNLSALLEQMPNQPFGHCACCATTEMKKSATPQSTRSSRLTVNRLPNRV